MLRTILDLEATVKLISALVLDRVAFCYSFLMLSRPGLGKCRRSTTQGVSLDADTSFILRVTVQFRVQLLFSQCSSVVHFCQVFRAVSPLNAVYCNIWSARLSTVSQPSLVSPVINFLAAVSTECPSNLPRLLDAGIIANNKVQTSGAVHCIQTCELLYKT
jgi:hypothetical protein